MLRIFLNIEIVILITLKSFCNRTKYVYQVPVKCNEMAFKLVEWNAEPRRYAFLSFVCRRLWWSITGPGVRRIALGTLWRHSLNFKGLFSTCFFFMMSGQGQAVVDQRARCANLSCLHFKFGDAITSTSVFLIQRFGFIWVCWINITPISFKQLLAAPSLWNRWKPSVNMFCCCKKKIDNSNEKLMKIAREYRIVLYFFNL